ncbi:hypothetical protein GCM10009560_58030 [Nonomuraea longicatena]|uniref:Uncharacterized protein n=1 Tax=Nonomuraea longicatena TaxID=83682 RepID=A0ABP4B558_9ACTN
MPRRILITLTSASALDDTGRTTGFYIAEEIEPWEIFGRLRDGEDRPDPPSRQPEVAAGIAVSGYDAVFSAGVTAAWAAPDSGRAPGAAVLTSSWPPPSAPSPDGAGRAGTPRPRGPR